MEYVGFVSTVFTPTDLRKDRKALDAAREDGASRIRDTDGESLLLIEERRVRQLAQREEVSTAVTDLFSRGSKWPTTVNQSRCWAIGPG